MGNVSGEEIEARLQRLIEYNFVDGLYLNDTKWHKTRSLFPHKCLFSKRWIPPFVPIIKGVRTINNKTYEFTHKEVYWADPAEFTLQKLKGRI